MTVTVEPKGLEHRFGRYGGQYVPETLMPALGEVEAAWLAARDDEAFLSIAAPARAGVVS